MSDSSKNPPFMGALSLGALGVVFGDIGTSPLYAFRESLAGEHNLAVDETNVLGVLSLMFWSLVIVISIKYLLIVMRADNHGEGGILALAALVKGREDVRRKLMLLGLFGTALLYGDGMITPAISVLSAVEGVEVAAPSIHSWVVPIVLVILVGLFVVQRQGTERVGRFFGPIMLIWFVVIALLGSIEIAKEPSIFRALDPFRAARFFLDTGTDGFLVLGSVFLVVTGGEALYADMGHFGRAPIKLGWFAIVLPALVLNYFGQGALLLIDPTAIENPFFLLAPSWAQWPMTILATAATVIASQALITGAFSLTVQAVNLGYLPRLKTIQTSPHHRGQVYVPAVNWFLLAACLGLVVAFGSSSRLAAAYGVAVTLTMVITTILIAAVAHNRWNWSIGKIALIISPLLLIDLAFASANIFKIPAGGWFPLVIGIGGFTIFTTFWKGRYLKGRQVDRNGLTVEAFVRGLQDDDPPLRRPGTAVYLHRRPGLVPESLLTNLRHNETLDENVVLVSVTILEQPHVHAAARDHRSRHFLGFDEIDMRYGFMDRVDLDNDLQTLLIDGLSFAPEITTYFLGRERIDVTGASGLLRWRGHLYDFLSRNARDPTAHFGVPRDRSIEIGTRVEL